MNTFENIMEKRAFALEHSRANARFSILFSNIWYFKGVKRRYYGVKVYAQVHYWTLWVHYAHTRYYFRLPKKSSVDPDQLFLSTLITKLAENLKYSKTCLKRPKKKIPRIGFQDRLLLNAGQKNCRMLQESILQYFWPSLSYHLSLRVLFCLFLSGRLRQVLLYEYKLNKLV